MSGTSVPHNEAYVLIDIPDFPSLLRGYPIVTTASLTRNNTRSHLR